MTVRSSATGGSFAGGGAGSTSVDVVAESAVPSLFVGSGSGVVAVDATGYQGPDDGADA